MTFPVPDDAQSSNPPLSQEERVLMDALSVAFDSMPGHSPFAALGDVYRIACQCLLRPATIEQARDVLARSATFQVEAASPIQDSRVLRLQRPSSGSQVRSAHPGR